MRRWRPPRRVLIALAAALISILVLEGLLRLFPLPLPDRFFEPNSDFGWFHIPDRTGWQATPEFRVPVFVNSQGLRDGEHTYAKPEGVLRVLVLGDSFAEGLQVPVEDTFGRQLQRLLDERGPGQFEVINAGVSRFGTSNELLFYRFEGRRYRPDLVVLLFFRNDVLDNVAVPYFTLEGGELRETSPKPQQVLGPAGALRGWLWDHLQTYRLAVIGGNLALAVLGVDNEATGMEQNAVFLREPSAAVAGAWELTAALLGQLDAEVAAAGARLVVVGIADRDAASHADFGQAYDTGLVNARLGDMLAARSIPYVDLLPGFAREYDPDGPLPFWPGDGHWNERGHLLAARTVFGELAARGLLDTDADNG